jgi:hypothetical protein
VGAGGAGAGAGALAIDSAFPLLKNRSTAVAGKPSSSILALMWLSAIFNFLILLYFAKYSSKLGSGSARDWTVGGGGVGAA